MLEEQEENLPVGELTARRYISQVGKIYDDNTRDRYFDTDHIDEFIKIYEKHYDGYIKAITDTEPYKKIFISEMYDSGEFNDITFRFSIDLYFAFKMNSNERIGYGMYYVLFVNILNSYCNSKFMHYLAKNDSDGYSVIDNLIDIYY